MNHEQRELFRLALLGVLRLNPTRFGLSLCGAAHWMGLFGFPSPDSHEMAQALDYLERKGLIEQVLKTLSPENRAWRITIDGLAYLDQRN